jgi:uncharacterized membrane protein
METPPMSNYPRGDGGNANYAMPTRGPGVYFDYIGIAWKMITKNPSVYIVGGIVMLIAAVAVQIPAQVLSMAMGGSKVSIDPTTGATSGGPSLALIPLTLVLSLVSSAVTTALMTGMSLAAIEEADTGSTRFETLFSGFKNFGNLFVGSILYTIAIYIGMLFCLVPGIYLSGALSLSLLIIIKEGLNGVDGLKASMERMKPYAFSMFGLLLVSLICSLLGAIACGIGLLVTWPIYSIVIGLTYRDFRSHA